MNPRPADYKAAALPLSYPGKPRLEYYTGELLIGCEHQAYLAGSSLVGGVVVGVETAAASSEAEFFSVSSSFWISANASSSPSRLATPWSVGGAGGVDVAGDTGGVDAGESVVDSVSEAGVVASSLGSATGSPAGGGSSGPLSVDPVDGSLVVVLVSVEAVAVVVGVGVGNVGGVGVVEGVGSVVFAPELVLFVALLSSIEESPFPSLLAISFANLIRLCVAFE